MFKWGIYLTGFVLPMAWAISPIWAASIDFEGLPKGTIVDELSTGAGLSGNVSGTVKVFGRNGLFGNKNVAIIFDSICAQTSLGKCTSIDPDLRTPHVDFGGYGLGDGGAAGAPFQNDTPLGNTLILAENLIDNNGDGLVDNPNDADVPGFFNFDFSGMGGKGKKGGTVTIDSITIMDVEVAEGEVPALIELSGPGILPSTISVFDMGDNGVATVNGIGVSGVSNLRVNVKGSSALVGVIFNENTPRHCWITTGGFQNAGVQAGSKDFTFGGNVGPPPSGSWQVVDHNTGDKFHSNDVHIVDCIVIDGTGPGQPGGKKGFKINQAFFEGTGRLNGVSGYPFTGFVIDRGEPSGKQGNDKDEFQIVVRDPNTDAVVFEASGPLDGGNVQIHPPNPSS